MKKYLTCKIKVKTYIIIIDFFPYLFGKKKMGHINYDL